MVDLSNEAPMVDLSKKPSRKLVKGLHGARGNRIAPRKIVDLVHFCISDTRNRDSVSLSGSGALDMSPTFIAKIKFPRSKRNDVFTMAENDGIKGKG